jgi:apolipoprotein N-acyltransferase
LRFAFQERCGNLAPVNLLSQGKTRYSIAVLAGLLWTGAFPNFNLAGLAWIAPGLLWFAAVDQKPGEAFRLGYVCGLVHYLSSLYWLLLIPFVVGAVVGWIALSLYLSLYPALWVWLCSRLFSGLPGRPGIAVSGDWWQRSLRGVLCAALWVSLEMVIGRFLSGFPWNLLGASQYRILPLIQIASVTGVYGISFLVVWFSVSLGLAAIRLTRGEGSRWSWLAELRIALAGITVVAMFGIHRVLTVPPPGRRLSLALVQPGIPQQVIWDHTQDDRRFKEIMNLSEAALATAPDALIWPEASMPDLSEKDFQSLTNLLARHGAWMIFGADDEERSAGANGSEDTQYFNAAFLFTPRGKYAASYHKQRLVMFGEYLPLARWFPFLRRLIPVPADFSPGRGPVAFVLSGPEARIGVLICFEDVFPHFVRSSVDDGTDLLLNLTNDGWFGRSAAQWQHAASAVFRAVENGLPLVRCTNNGLTCWVDARGRMVEILGLSSGDVYAAGFLTAVIPLPAAAQKEEPTFYRRHGDWFGWSCVAASSLAFLARFKRSMRPGSKARSDASNRNA